MAELCELAIRLLSRKLSCHSEGCFAARMTDRSWPVTASTLHARKQTFVEPPNLKVRLSEACLNWHCRPGRGVQRIFPKHSPIGMAIA